ncbi:MAG: PTS transporter subunit EIIB, partial [Gemmatimonadota bacterium]|nr:PTS transporter subunit EIIB [Gemmatimonadota bacterium]
FKMWGLPAAAIAIWRTAKPENRARIGGIMISAALTSFLTGITEPIEFAFLFVAPVLYAVHALLAGAAYWVAIELGIHHSTTFSHGLIDFVVLYPHSTRGWWLLWLGPLWGLMYYTIFRTIILRWNLKTPGREPDDAVQSAADRASSGTAPVNDSMAAKLVAAFGGAANIRSLDACITRLRLELFDNARANADTLRALGATGVMTVPGGMQAIFGTRSENLKTDMEEYMQTSGDNAAVSAVAAASLASTAAFPAVKRIILSPALRDRAKDIVAALGGASNIVRVEACALTRLRVELRDPELIVEAALARAGAPGVWRQQSGAVHVIVGEDAAALAAALTETRAEIALSEA